jgi:GntR family transcriptional regulator
MGLMTKVRRIVETILADIASGRLGEGDRVDSERQITARFGVSLGTAQGALKELQHLGVLKREHGRGTFVRASKDAVLDARFIRFKGKDGAILPIRSEIISVRRLVLTGAKRAFFGADDKGCVRIARRLDIGGAFEMASEFFLGEEELERLSRTRGAGLEGNIRENLNETLALPTLRVEQSLAFVRLPKSAVDLLRLPSPCNGFRMEMRAHTVQDRPLFLQVAFGVDFGGKTLVLDR